MRAVKKKKRYGKATATKDRCPLCHCTLHSSSKPRIGGAPAREEQFGGYSVPNICPRSSAKTRVTGQGELSKTLNILVENHMQT